MQPPRITQSDDVQQLHTQRDEARKTMDEYARQLDTLRRQRNEASWFLGEERTTAAKREQHVEEITQEIRQWQAKTNQWQQAAELARKQWEEGQWSLGESKAAAGRESVERSKSR